MVGDQQVFRINEKHFKPPHIYLHFKKYSDRAKLLKKKKKRNVKSSDTVAKTTRLK
jgi:hypothetical protein